MACERVGKKLLRCACRLSCDCPVTIPASPFVGVITLEHSGERRTFEWLEPRHVHPNVFHALLASGLETTRWVKTRANPIAQAPWMRDLYAKLLAGLLNRVSHLGVMQRLVEQRHLGVPEGTVWWEETIAVMQSDFPDVLMQRSFWTDDLPENWLIREAIERLFEMGCARHPSLVRYFEELAHVSREFVVDPSHEIALEDHNYEWSDILQLSRAILRSLNVRNPPAGSLVFAVPLFDPAAAFENFVIRGLKMRAEASFPQSFFDAKYTTWPFEEYQRCDDTERKMVFDGLWRVGDVSVIIDAKFKAGSRISSDDLYQQMAYARVTSGTDGIVYSALVYPNSCRDNEVRHGNFRCRAFGMNLDNEVNRGDMFEGAVQSLFDEITSWCMLEAA